MANLGGRGTATHAGPNAAGNIDRGLRKHDIGIIGSGVLGLVASFLPWFGVKYRGYDSYGQLYTWHDNVNAWYSGALAWLPVVLLLVCAGLAAAHLMGKGRASGLGSPGASTAIATLSAVSLLLIVLRWITLPHYHGSSAGFPGLSSGARAGLILGLIAAIAATFFALRRLKASGGHGLMGGRDGALTGYSGRGTDRSRELDREREYAGRDTMGRDTRDTMGRDAMGRESMGHDMTGRRDTMGHEAAGRESTMGREPTAGREPTSGREPTAGREPTTGRETTGRGPTGRDFSGPGDERDYPTERRYDRGEPGRADDDPGEGFVDRDRWDR
ncbi:hypothetical protein I6A84_28980 [Frankia sp. CNm7]|uniref:Uncharacterized protein n=1 Tax=Frankia nepalensis TaxID=1836974 RepID=A0A937UQJ6_9ACTN|nr:hypothetical protein [Frankia nepalensis]MBL7500602.1 hypothetical protein [Frankia nepalensis]MBL7510997.1 hypothetical protein [Frankia nepalensis]MBL7522005.1 hypothetical protein [Frankia nepalensis]MBL7630302.1 hypothetical protein [Frankia nepalensis]